MKFGGPVLIIELSRGCINKGEVLLRGIGGFVKGSQEPEIRAPDIALRSLLWVELGISH